MIDLVRYDSMFSQDVLGPSDAKGQLDRWTIDLAKGTVHMERKDDRHLEFPRINETFTGKQHRYGYLPDVENFFGSGEAAGRASSNTTTRPDLPSQAGWTRNRAGGDVIRAEPDVCRRGRRCAHRVRRRPPVR